MKFNFLDIQAYRSLRLPVSKKLRPILVLAAFVLLHLPFLDIESVFFLLHLGLISTLYNVPENSTGIVRVPLRSIPVLKIFLIAYVWSSIASFLPSLVENNSVLTSSNLILFAAHFLFIFAITLPFDIRDFVTDGKNKLITFPQLTGVLTTKVIALVSLLGFTVIIFLFVGSWYIPLFSSIVALLIMKSSVKRPDYYFTFYLDGTIILYFIAVLLSLK